MAPDPQRRGMPHGFTVETDDANHLSFGKTHKNGEKTVVDLERDIPGEDDA